MDIMQFFEKRRKEVAATFASNPYMIIHVDVDKTLTMETCWTEYDCEHATPNQEMIDVINRLGANNVIIAYTARQDHLIPSTLRWLRKAGVRFDAISNTKQATCMYIDDKAFNPFIDGCSIKEEPYP